MARVSMTATVSKVLSSPLLLLLLLMMMMSAGSVCCDEDLATYPPLTASIPHLPTPPFHLSRHITIIRAAKLNSQSHN